MKMNGKNKNFNRNLEYKIQIKNGRFTFKTINRNIQKFRAINQSNNKIKTKKTCDQFTP